ncbi:MAG: B12-binding domain-containing radical SAM protein [Spirochaetes bacterium]|nr:B12-binding domain-containing radical SAM protein [Spirochaetota bacterium]
MNLLLCNPKNAQGTTHSRKGMYVPLGILSIATELKNTYQDKINITVIDEDIELANLNEFGQYDLIGFYSTTYNYPTCIYYAKIAKEYGSKTVLGGPHASVLAKNILLNQSCFDFIIRYEGEKPFLDLVGQLLNNKKNYDHIPNLVFNNQSTIVFNDLHTTDLKKVNTPSREFINIEKYIKNFEKLYPDKIGIRPGSIYSSKGCSWRDKSGGCIFCARLEQGVRCRTIETIWDEIKELKNRYSVNSIWDISDDNLNNLEWFFKFTKSRPKECNDLSFFIYSRVNFISEQTVQCMKELNVEEVFLGIESGDNEVLKNSYKGQTVATILKAVELLKKYNIKYFPSFVLGLPGESVSSLENTYSLCNKLADLGGVDRLGCTILQPMPGSLAYQKILDETDFGKKIASLDHIDVLHLEKFWADNFTNSNYDTLLKYRNKITTSIKGLKVFGNEEE